MPDDTTTPVAETTAATTPTSSGAIFAKKPASSLTFAERGQLFFKKYQYINGQNLDPVAAEEKAREDLGLEPMTDSEIDSTKKPGLVTRVVDHPVLQSLGASAAIHRTWDTLIEGKKVEATAAVGAKKDEALATVDVKKTEAIDAVTEKKDATVAAATEKRDEAVAAVEAKKAETIARVDAAKHTAENKVQSLRDTAAEKIIAVAEKIAGHEIVPHTIVTTAAAPAETDTTPVEATK